MNIIVVDKILDDRGEIMKKYQICEEKEEIVQKETKKIKQQKNGEATMLITDDTTIYAIDMECMKEK